MIHPRVRLLTVIPNFERSRAVGRLLALLGYEVLGATDVPCARLLVAHTRPDALLVDAALAPAECAGLRPAAPLLAVDTLANMSTARRWLAAGAAAYCPTLPSSATLEHTIAWLCPAHMGGPRRAPWANVGLLAALAAHDQRGARHARRVAALAIGLGRHIGLERESVLQLGWGALLHEVGRLALPREALGPARLLTPHQRHMRGQLPRLALHIVGALPLGELAHAAIGGPECCLSSRGPADGQAHLGQRIVAIADAYDTLARAHPALPSEGILAYLQARHGWDGAIVAALRAVLAAEAASPPLARAVGAPGPVQSA